MSICLCGRQRPRRLGIIEANRAMVQCSQNLSPCPKHRLMICIAPTRLNSLPMNKPTHLETAMVEGTSNPTRLIDGLGPHLTRGVRGTSATCTDFRSVGTASQVTQDSTSANLQPLSPEHPQFILKDQNALFRCMPTIDMDRVRPVHL